MTDRGSIDLSDFVGKIKALYPGIDADEVYPKAIMKGAQLLGDRVEAATPTRTTDLVQPQSQYKTKGHTRWHPPGQAGESVIEYKRKSGKSYSQGEINANVSVLVGYEKSKAYYMYFHEYGNKFQPARPVIRPVFDAGVDEALQVALDYIQKDHEKRLAG
jgi:HK97 gp10 family phage protein